MYKASKIKIFLAALAFLILLSAPVTVRVNAAVLGGGGPAPSSTPAPTSTCTSTNAKCPSCESPNQTAGKNCVTCVPNPAPDSNDIGCGDPAATQCNHDACDLISKYVNPLISLLTAVVGVVVIISIIYGAIQFSTSAGDPQKAAKARGHIVNTVLALVAYIFLYAFLQFLIPGGLLHK